MDFQYNLISRNGILFIGYDVENLCIDFKRWLCLSLCLFMAVIIAKAFCKKLLKIKTHIICTPSVLVL
jgi:hypothetical protein